MKKKSAAPTTAVALTVDVVKEITTLAHRQIRLEELITDVENGLAALKEEHRILSTETIPAAMDEAGVAELKLETGETIKVKPDFAVTIPVENRERAYAWLEANGYDSIIKTEVITAFGRGELTKARTLVAALAKKHLSVTLVRGVHPQTLKAFVAESVRAARRIPMALFGAQPFNRTEVKPPREKRS